MDSFNYLPASGTVEPSPRTFPAPQDTVTTPTMHEHHSLWADNVFLEDMMGFDAS